MIKLHPVFEHSVMLENTAVEEDFVEIIKARFLAALVRFIKAPHILIEGLLCTEIAESQNKEGALIFERKLAIGKTCFSDSVMVMDEAIHFLVQATNDIPASLLVISIEGGKKENFRMRFRYEEDVHFEIPDNIALLRQKAWVAKDRDIANWCARQVGF